MNRRMVLLRKTVTRFSKNQEEIDKIEQNEGAHGDQAYESFKDNE